MKIPHIQSGKGIDIAVNHPNRNRSSEQAHVSGPVNVIVQSSGCTTNFVGFTAYRKSLKLNLQVRLGVDLDCRRHRKMRPARNLLATDNGLRSLGANSLLQSRFVRGAYGVTVFFEKGCPRVRFTIR